MSKIGRLISNHYNTNRVTGIYNESLAYLLGNLEEILKSSSVRNFLEVAKQGGQGFILNSVILGDVWASSLFSLPQWEKFAFVFGPIKVCCALRDSNPKPLIYLWCSYWGVPNSNPNGVNVIFHVLKNYHLFLLCISSNFMEFHL